MSVAYQRTDPGDIRAGKPTAERFKEHLLHIHAARTHLTHWHYRLQRWRRRKSQELARPPTAVHAAVMVADSPEAEGESLAVTPAPVEARLAEQLTTFKSLFDGPNEFQQAQPQSTGTPTSVQHLGIVVRVVYKHTTLRLSLY